MADENQQQHEFYQIPHVGVPEPDKDAYTRTDTSVPIRRAIDMKMSNFGALSIGARFSTIGMPTVSGISAGTVNDYTRVHLGFAAKGILEGAAEFGLHDLVQDAERNENPLVWDSTVKYTWNDEMFKMGMDTDDGKTLRAGGSKTSNRVSFPKFDVMDTNLVTAAGQNADRTATWQKNWPSEGWRSFGGKYDFHEAYTGGGFKH